MIRRVLLVCTGNTCRSPMAAALLSQRWKQAAPERELEVLSAGTGSVPGEPASAHAVTAMSGRGLDLTGHRSQAAAGTLLESADLILTMTTRHKDYILGNWPALAGRVYTLGEYAGTPQDVADPFGGTLADYEATASELEHTLQAVVERVRREG